MEPITPVDLAKAFIDKMIDTLTEEQWTLMIDRNRSETNPSICHSHDFCDANQVMLDAMASLGIDDTVVWSEDNPTVRLTREAFAIAKVAEFREEHIAEAAAAVQSIPLSARPTAAIQEAAARCSHLTFEDCKTHNLPIYPSHKDLLDLTTIITNYLVSIANRR